VVHIVHAVGGLQPKLKSGFDKSSDMSVSVIDYQEIKIRLDVLWLI
jgi:hypothetical protein